MALIGHNPQFNTVFLHYTSEEIVALCSYSKKIILTQNFEDSCRHTGHAIRTFITWKNSTAIHCLPLHTAPFMFSNGLCVSAALPTRHSSFPDRKSLQGLSPHHRWPFNTSLATANEPGVAAAWLDPADFAQMFISHSPAVLGLEVHFSLGSILTLFIYLYLFVAGTLNSVWRIWRCCAVREGRHSLSFILLYLAESSTVQRNQCSQLESFSIVYFLLCIVLFLFVGGGGADAWQVRFSGLLLLPHRNL